MGARTGNYLRETFAVALSLEVLRRLGYEGYLLVMRVIIQSSFPSPPQRALARKHWQDNRAY